MRRNRGFQAVLAGVASAVLASAISCTTLPEPKIRRYRFPKEVHFGEPKRPYQVVGSVRTRVEYSSLLSPAYDDQTLCRNYFNKAAADLLRRARKNGADAVIDVKSVVFLFDGRMETYPSAECSDDGADGQVLAQGIAVKWVTAEKAAQLKREAAATPAHPLSDREFSASEPEPVELPEEGEVSERFGDDAEADARQEEEAEPEFEKEPEFKPEAKPASRPRPRPMMIRPDSPPFLR